MLSGAGLRDRLGDAALLRTDALIGGAWVGSTGRFAVHDPAKGDVLASVALLGAPAAQAAVDAAEHALPAWRALPAKDRAAVLLRWFQLIQQRQDDLALILTSEQGKPLAEARGEVGYGASFVQWFAEEARRAYGETVPTTDPAKRYLVLKQAIGVCAAITPWNFPIAMITRKVAPALAAGCTVVLKPAEATPLSALALAELAQRAGLPAGVLNVVTTDAAGAAEVGRVWCDSTVVRHLSFTGSTEVGRILIDDDALAKVEAHVEDALRHGARVACGGQRLGGRFYAPTVLAGATADMRCAREETFGPVAAVFRFEDEAEAVRAANACETGLAAYLFSRDIGRIFRVAEALEAGMVGINTGLISTAEVPFGGVKQSGLGREGARHGLDEYLELKYLCLGGLQ
jgi:acyl-CoA reductase-like NAD-dependent aldehyde dehydrogenase